MQNTQAPDGGGGHAETEKTAVKMAGLRTSANANAELVLVGRSLTRKFKAKIPTFTKQKPKTFSNISNKIFLITYKQPFLPPLLSTLTASLACFGFLFIYFFKWGISYRVEIHIEQGEQTTKTSRCQVIFSGTTSYLAWTKLADKLAYNNTAKGSYQGQFSWGKKNVKAAFILQEEESGWWIFGARSIQ